MSTTSAVAKLLSQIYPSGNPVTFLPKSLDAAKGDKLKAMCEQGGALILHEAAWVYACQLKVTSNTERFPLAVATVRVSSIFASAEPKEKIDLIELLRALMESSYPQEKIILGMQYVAEVAKVVRNCVLRSKEGYWAKKILEFGSQPISDFYSRHALEHVVNGAMREGMDKDFVAMIKRKKEAILAESCASH